LGGSGLIEENMANIDEIWSLLHVAPDYAKAVILPESGISVTYECLRKQVTRVAQELTAMSIRPGTRVATVFFNGLPAVIAFLAASTSGTALPLNPVCRYEEFCSYFRETTPGALLCSAEGSEEVRRAAETHRIPIVFIEVNADGLLSMSGASKKADKLSIPSPEDIALVLYTSGSTARPKRVPLTHRQLMVSCANVVSTYGLSSADVSLCVMPLFHMHGLIAPMLSTFLSEGTVILPSKVNLRAFWMIIAKHRVTWYSAVPTFHQLVLRVVDDARRGVSAGTLRFVRSCSAPLSPLLMEKMESLIQVPVLEAYGMTEAAHQICSNPLPPGARKPGSVGMATGVNASIIDDDGNHLESTQIGEVVIQGPSVMSRYENEEMNSISFVDGWFRTGDQGFFDHNGYLTLTGRLKELINRGGEKIGPREIDEVLLTHPAVAEAVAFGIPHSSLGEEVAAAVVLRAPEQERALINYCRQRLAKFKCPRKIFILESIPHTSTGKIQRQLLAASLVRANQ